jgi:deoxyribodipyrimidine photo-lyase
MHKRRAIVWFRNDLRLHDNEALHDALLCADEVIPVYVFDERVFFGHTRFGFRKTGPYRTKFILESVSDLRRSLKQLGSHLYIRIGKPEEEIFQIATQTKTSWVFCNRERTQEEVDVQDALEQNLWTIGQELRYCRGKMLYHTADLPFPVTHTPEIFTQFRKEVERYIPIREPFPAPTGPIRPLSIPLDPGEIPSMETLRHEDFEHDDRAALHFHGGETEALNRLRYYLWETDLVKTYKETRNELLGGDYSSKLSPWLAQGCISPKQIYHELQRYEAERGANDSTYWLFFELLWRDFFRLIAKKHCNKIFQKGGIRSEPNAKLRNDREALQRWINGATGTPFIDANMRELGSTGFMSNRGRQNAASFLVNDLQVNWQMGAEYFESLLLDYDPASNWGNWNYIAGVGNDPRENRVFNPQTQAMRYDPQGEYVAHWIPELAGLSPEEIHRPGARHYAEPQW